MALADFYRLEITYGDFWKANPAVSLRYTKSLQRWKAYEILQEQSKRSGPGVILTEFDPTPFDQTLTIAVYSFNAARNPRLDYHKSTWAGLITNVNYVPYLYHQIPSSQWFPFPWEWMLPWKTWPWESFRLILIPQKQSRWLAANGEKSLGRLLGYTFFQMPYGQLNPDISKMLGQCRSLVNNDPFLESSLDEKQFSFMI